MEAILINGSVSKHLAKLTVPMIWGILVIMSFNLIDVYFISKLRLKELTSISFTFPIVLIYGNLGFGLSTGTTSVASNLIGQGDTQEIKKFSTNSLIISFLCVLIFVIIGLYTIKI